MILFISNTGECLPIAYRLKREAVDCSVYIHNPDCRHNYDEIIEKVPIGNLRKTVLKAELVIFDITRPNRKEKQDFALLKLFGCKSNSTNVFGAVGDKIKKYTKVIGASSETEEIEMDRKKGSDLARKIGLSIPEVHEFKNLEDGKSFLRGRTDRWVLKPFENQDLDLTYVEKYPGELFHKMEGELPSRIKGPKFEFMLQKVIEGVEIDIEGWFDGNEFVHFNHTIEDKRLMDGNLGPAIGSQNNTVWIKKKSDFLLNEIKKLVPLLKSANYIGPIDFNVIVSEEDHKPYFLEFCYSDDTEILTKEGWKKIKDVQVGEIVAGLNDKKELVYVPVEQTTRLSWNQPILHIYSKNCYDLKVTPNHQMVVLDKKGQLKFKPAKLLSKKSEKTIRTAIWKGIDDPIYTIPEYSEKHHLGRYNKDIELIHPERKIPMEDWCRFLGLFIAEGSLHFRGRQKPNQIQITQTRKIKECEKIISAIGFPWNYRDNDFVINSVQLGSEILKLCGHKKSFEKRIPRFILDLSPKYIQAFLDGFLVGDGNIHKRTKQKTYYTSSPGLADDIGECLLKTGIWYRITKIEPNGKSYANKTQYRISERKIKKDGRIFPKRHCKYVPYNGDVVCVVVPHHRIYVRRPGGPSIWCGQTPRFGYDAIYCFLSLIKGSLKDFFMKNFKADFYDGYVSSERISIPPYPYSSKELLEKYAKDVPIGGRIEQFPFFWMEDVYKKGGSLACAGSDGVLGVVTGRGITIGDSVSNVYKNIEKLKIGSYMQFRTDLGKRAKKAIETLKQWGIEVD